MKRKKVAIIGHFGENENFLDGQTIKTRILYDELLKATNWRIKTVDTFLKSKNPLKLIFDSIIILVGTKDIIVLVAENGMKTYFPILYFFSKVFKTKIYHDVIGGSIGNRVEKFPKFKKYLNSFKVNWVETKGVNQQLKSLGVTNSELLYNFKPLKILSENEMIKEYSEPYSLCAFSRVMKEKGIEDAVEAVKAVNEKNGRIVFTLDIYGQVDAEQIDWFEELKEKFPYYVKYRGSVPYDKSVETLKGYFALIFPTKYYTEGVPGTIIDAYAAGLPVIASYWENFDNIVDEKTGVSYQFNNVEDFVRVLTEIAEKPEIMIEKKRNCIERAADFTPETVLKQIISKITEE